jgi:hypothetical protein
MLARVRVRVRGWVAPIGNAADVRRHRALSTQAGHRLATTRTGETGLELVVHLGEPEPRVPRDGVALSTRRTGIATSSITGPTPTHPTLLFRLERNGGAVPEVER